jgi:hypothetical protein
MTHTMVLNCVTNGVPSRRGLHAPQEVEHYNDARMIEFAYTLLPNEYVPTRTEPVQPTFYHRSWIVRPDGFYVNDDGRHGITHDQALRHGTPWGSIFDALHADVPRCSVLVAHHLAFHLSVLLSECYRAQQPLLVSLLSALTPVCTMTLHTLPRKPWPSLEQLWVRLHPGASVPGRTFRALPDLDLVAGCYQQILIRRYRRKPPVLLALPAAPVVAPVVAPTVRRVVNWAEMCDDD